VVKKIGDVFDARAGEAVAGARALARGGGNIGLFVGSDYCVCVCVCVSRG
jgi:hypothetical protein